ncbi:UvrB/UvrC motif-containing protein [Calidifontibacillus erzurumensis]|uniref:UvrB/UvrC motif-containing protein n=1 Tax=Calidifontibacillus erzurumensis TaxID=2741433 RepID=UPI001E351811|nr:UvrB/UvrC motif-containing protein [Calidifontibacillus erzurumensis]
MKDFDYIITDTEFDAFLLECQLIKELKPLYNKLMKSPESYTYIKFDMTDELHTIKLTNEINENSCSLFFGPFSSKNTVEKAIKGLKEIYKIECNHIGNRKSACLNYSLGLCLGMCFQSSAIDKHNQIIGRIIALLEGRDTRILQEMEQEMNDSSIHFDFEKAAKIRDCLSALKSLLKKEKVIEFTKANLNIVVIEFLNDKKMKLFFIHRNKVLYNYIYDLNIKNLKEVRQLVKANILHVFKIRESSPGDCINKEEIDEANIIYSYLKTNVCKYLIIPDDYLDLINHHRLEKALDEFLFSIVKDKTTNIQ